MKRVWIIMLSLVLVAGIVSGCTPEQEVKKPTVTARGYVAGSTGFEIAIIDVETKELIGTPKIFGDAHGLGVTPDGRWVFVGDVKSGKYTVFDTKEMKIVKQIEVPGALTTGHGHGHPNSKYVYVQGSKHIEGGGYVAVISVEKMEVVNMYRISPMKQPYHLVLDTAGKRLYVNSRDGEDVIYVFNVKADGSELEFVDKVWVGGDPEHVAVSPDGRWLFTGLGKENVAAMIDTETLKVVTRIPVGKEPHGVAVTQDSKYLLTANKGEGSYSIVDIEERKEIKRVEIGPAQHMCAQIAPDGFLWVTASVLNQRIYIINPNPPFDIAKEIYFYNGHQIHFGTWPPR